MKAKKSKLKFQKKLLNFSEKRKFKAFLVSFFVLVFFLSIHQIVKSWDSSLVGNVSNANTNMKVCSLSATQPAVCYSGPVNPTFRWTYVSPDPVFPSPPNPIGGTPARFRIQIDNNADFSSLTYDTGWINGGVSGNNSYTIPGAAGLAVSTRYFWRINVEDQWGGRSGFYVAAESFFTMPSCPNGGTNFNACTIGIGSQPGCWPIGQAPTVQFNWSYVSPDPAFPSPPNQPGAPQQAFWLMVDDNSDFSSPEYNSGWIAQATQTYTLPNNASNNLDYNTQYYWAINIRDTSFSESGFLVEGASFITVPECLPAPAVPTLDSINFISWVDPPPPPYTDANVRADWTDNQAGGSDYFVARKADDNAFTVGVVNSPNINAPTHVWNTQQPQHTTKFYQVKACYSLSGCSNWSNWLQLDVPWAPIHMVASSSNCAAIELEFNYAGGNNFEVRRSIEAAPWTVLWTGAVDDLGGNNYRYTDYSNLSGVDFVSYEIVPQGADAGASAVFNIDDPCPALPRWIEIKF